MKKYVVEDVDGPPPATSGFVVEDVAGPPPGQLEQQGEQPKGLFAAGLAGAGRAIAGMPGIVGDIQSLARKAEPYIGIKTPKNPWIQAPTSAEMVEKAAEYVPGIKYEPQTTGEKYAASVGSFLPGALMGGGGIARNALAFGVAPGLASEAAGQMTEGTAAEPYARVAGGLLGGMAGPALANAPGRIISPIRQNPDVAQHVANVTGEGVKSLTAAQKTGSRGLGWLEQTAMDNPLTMRNAEQVARTQGEDLARAASKKTGYEAPKLLDDYFADTQTELSNEYRVLHSRNRVNIDPQLQGDVGSAAAEYSRINNAPSPLVDSYVRKIGSFRTQRGGQLAGDEYQFLRNQLDGDIKAVSRQNYAEGLALEKIRDSLDDAMARSLPPDDAQKLMDLNRRYANFKVLEEAAAKRGQNIARGYVEPGAILSAVTERNAKALVRGKSDLGNLARSMEAIGTKLPQSGTQPRQMAQNLLSLGGGTGATAGGILGGLPGAAMGYVAGQAIPAITSNLIMSRPVQAYLGNQAARRLGLLADVDRARRARGLLYGGASGYAGQPSR